MLWLMFLMFLAGWMAAVATGFLLGGAVHLLLIAAVLTLVRQIQHANYAG